MLKLWFQCTKTLVSVYENSGETNLLRRMRADASGGATKCWFDKKLF